MILLSGMGTLLVVDGTGLGSPDDLVVRDKSIGTLVVDDFGALVMTKAPTIILFLVW